MKIAIKSFRSLEIYTILANENHPLPIVYPIGISHGVFICLSGKVNILSGL